MRHKAQQVGVEAAKVRIQGALKYGMRTEVGCKGWKSHKKAPTRDYNNLVYTGFPLYPAHQFLDTGYQHVKVPFLEVTSIGLLLRQLYRHHMDRRIMLIKRKMSGKILTYTQTGGSYYQTKRKLQKNAHIQ